MGKGLSLARLNDLPIGSKMLSGGALLALLFLLFLAVLGFGYHSASQSQALAADLQAGVHRINVLTNVTQSVLLGDRMHDVSDIQRDLSDTDQVLGALRSHYRDAAPGGDFETRFVPLWNQLRKRIANLDTGGTDQGAAVVAQLRDLRRASDDASETLQALAREAHELGRDTNQRTAWIVGAITVAIFVSILVLFFVLHRNIAGRLARMNATVTRMETSGDLSLRLPVDARDEIGHLAQACNDLAQKTADTMARERQEKEDLDEMIDIILGVTDGAAKGDLTRVLMEFHGNKGIDQLANGVRSMIDSLNRLIAEVRESGFQVAQSSSEIAASAVQQEATTSELAATSNQISASASEIAATSKELAHTMDDVYQVMHATTGAAERGQTGIDSMGRSIRAMVNAVDTISAKLETLNEKAGNINMVVSTITKVADQTNLLSLNAAIEAEKAGEYGKGFSVVATEIRRLADQTAVSTWDIEQMVKEIQSATSACVMVMEKVSGEIHQGADNVGQVSGQLTEIIDKVQVLLPEFESVKESIHAQSDGATQISDSIRQLNDSVQETAESLRKSNSAIGRLRDAVQVLNNGVARFTIN